MTLPGQSQTYTFATVAGNLAGSGSADGTNGSAQFSRPSGIAVDAQGNLYIADQFNCTIRKITPAGASWVVTTIAGKAGQYNPNRIQDGTNSSALFNLPTGVAVDPSGNLYVADQADNSIRKITPIGTNWVVTTIAGQGPSYGGFSNGLSTVALLNTPLGVAVDANSNVFVADYYNNAIRQITPVPGSTNWMVTTIAGSGPGTGNELFQDGTNTYAEFNGPTGVALDTNGNLYVADQFHNAIRLMTPSGTNWIVTTIAGGRRGSADGPNGLFYQPTGTAVDASGNVYVADEFNDTIRQLSAATGSWVTTTIGGSAGITGTNNGSGTNALFYRPFGVAVGGNGSVYVADSINNVIRVGSLPSVGGFSNLLVTVGFVTNGFAMNYYGTLGSNYTLLASPDFVNWFPVFSFSCTNSPVYLVDLGAGYTTDHFYRVEQGTVASPP